MSGAVRTPGLRWSPKTQIAHLEVCVPGTGGKVRRRKTVAAKNRKEAVEEWGKFRAEVAARGGRVTRWTLRTYWTAFGDRLKAGLAKTSKANITYQVRTLIELLGELPLEKMNAATAKDLEAMATERGFAPSTVNTLLSALRHVLHDATDRGEVAKYRLGRKLPFAKVTTLEQELSEEEQAKLLAAFDDEAGYMRRLARSRVEDIAKHGQAKHPVPDGDAAKVYFSFFSSSKPLFVVALETGIAKADLRTLAWSHISGGVIRLKRTKTGVDAVIPVSAACAAALKELKERPVVGARVFLGPNGKPVCWDTVKMHFKLAKELAGIRRTVRFHDLRHTFASRLASRGISLQVISKALGHRSVQMSARYARPDEDAMLSIKRALDGGETNTSTNSERRSDGTK